MSEVSLYKHKFFHCNFSGGERITGKIIIFILHRVQILSANNTNDNLFFSFILHIHLLKLKLKIQSRTHFFASSPVLNTESLPIFRLFHESICKPNAPVQCEILTSFSRLLELIKKSRVDHKHVSCKMLFYSRKSSVLFSHQHLTLSVSQLPKAEEIQLHARPKPQLVFHVDSTHFQLKLVRT